MKGNTFAKIKKSIKTFCNGYPPNGFELNYLENGERILKLYGKASAILEEESSPESEKKLEEIYEEIKTLAGE